MSAAPELPSSRVYRLPPAAVHELLGWNVWSAVSAHAWVEVLRVDDRVEIELAEVDDDRRDRAVGATRMSRTRLVLGADGLCTATHTASPSLLHVRHIGVEMAAADRDGSGSQAALAQGDVLVATTASFLQVAPAALLSQIPMRTRRRRSLAGLADDLVRRLGPGAAGERVGIVVVQRVWPAGA